ncbi:hypothetical protein C8R45DRAFT_929064 [Mycena sanguinolenta]|nr:hypothetical protein C8R45DRAFT_929064 [Mycena sanguinolenta]
MDVHTSDERFQASEKPRGTSCSANERANTDIGIQDGKNHKFAVKQTKSRPHSRKKEGALCGLDSRTVVGALPSADCASQYYSAFCQSPSNLLLLYTLRDEEDLSLKGETRWSGRVAPGDMGFCRRYNPEQPMSMLAQHVLWWFAFDTRVRVFFFRSSVSR